MSNKVVYKYDINGRFIHSYKNTQQCANDFGVDESTIRKRLTIENDPMFFKDYYLSRNKYSNIFGGKEVQIKNPQAKVLVFDIETSPMVAFVWRMWDQNISQDQVIDDWYITCWSAKWLFDSKVYSDCITPEEAKSIDSLKDRRVVESLWHMINKADVIIGHNIKNFDIPKMNTRFLLCGLQPPSSYQVIDTKQSVTGGTFGFSSNKMDYIADTLGLGRKYKTDFDLWKGCYRGEIEALNYMELYNKRDVVVNEEVYINIRAWIRNHPNIGLYEETEGKHCPVCGHTQLSEVGPYVALVHKYMSYRCDNCGALSRSSKRIDTQTVLEERMVTISR